MRSPAIPSDPKIITHTDNHPREKRTTASTMPTDPKKFLCLIASVPAFIPRIQQRLEPWISRSAPTL
jgi:hypothetical protein